jgi:hypothetical protein
MFHSRGANGTDAEIVWTQILQGLGGGIASTATNIASQASVPHVDVAVVIAFVLLLTEIGGSIGNGVGMFVHTFAAQYLTSTQLVQYGLNTCQRSLLSIYLTRWPMRLSARQSISTSMPQRPIPSVATFAMALSAVSLRTILNHFDPSHSDDTSQHIAT